MIGLQACCMVENIELKIPHCNMARDKTEAPDKFSAAPLRLLPAVCAEISKSPLFAKCSLT
jgi:hypothetical protein